MNANKIVWLCLLLFLDCHAASVEAAELRDGLYVISDKPTAFPFTTLDGDKVYIGSKLPDKLKEETLTSLSNDNSSYRLMLTHIGPFSAQISHIALVLKGKCAQFYGWGGVMIERMRWIPKRIFTTAILSNWRRPILR